MLIQLNLKQTFIPVRIICIATAAMINPVRRINGPSMWVRVRKLLMLLEQIISRKLMKMANPNDRVV